MTTINQAGNRYLEGDFAPVQVEVTATDLAVSGTIPPALNGRFLRNGPNPVACPEPSAYHWFTGEGMVHGIRLRDGKAEWYRNRWVRSAAVARSLGETVRPGPVHGGMDFAPNTNVIGLGERTLALVEGGARPYQLDYELGTVGPTDLGGSLPAGYTAHPKRDPHTGELHAVSYFWGWGNTVQYSVIGTGGCVQKIVDVPVGGPIMLHDMSLTATYAVIYDLPVLFDLQLATSGASFPYRWDPDYQARVGLLPRSGGADDVRWFDVEPCYVFHPLNAYDDGEDVVLDVIRHPKMFDHHLTGPDEGPPSLERWTIDAASGRLTAERLDDRPQEFPRVDERVVGLPHRYGYTAASLAGHAAVIKHDFADGSSEVRYTGSGDGSSEAVFVPRDPDAGEDDGWVMTLVHDGERNAADLLILSSQDLTGPPEAVVHLPARVPLGFHGNWVPD